MNNSMNTCQKSTFEKAAKRLHDNQRQALKNAIDAIISAISEVEAKPKPGKLLKGYNDVYSYRFTMLKGSMRLIYTYDEQTQTLTLICFGHRKEVYRVLKRISKEGHKKK